MLDLAGRAVDPLAAPDAAAVVLLFTRTDCPISNRYAPEVRRLFERFHERGVRFWLVYPDPDSTVEDIERHLAEYAYPLPALRDPRHVIVAPARRTSTCRGSRSAGSGYAYSARCRSMSSTVLSGSG